MMNMHLSISLICYIFLSVLVINLLKIVNHLVSGKTKEDGVRLLCRCGRRCRSSQQLFGQRFVIRSHRAHIRSTLEADLSSQAKSFPC